MLSALQSHDQILLLHLLLRHSRIKYLSLIKSLNINSSLAAHTLLITHIPSSRNCHFVPFCLKINPLRLPTIRSVVQTRCEVDWALTHIPDTQPLFVNSHNSIQFQANTQSWCNDQHGLYVSGFWIALPVISCFPEYC